jgi:hypothetical protein
MAKTLGSVTATLRKRFLARPLPTMAAVSAARPISEALAKRVVTIKKTPQKLRASGEFWMMTLSIIT